VPLVAIIIVAIEWGAVEAIELLSAWAQKQSYPMPLYEQQPLKIADTVAAGEMSSFKHPWDQASCKRFINTTGWFEASGFGGGCPAGFYSG
jgi:hypothetical protein